MGCSQRPEALRQMKLARQRPQQCQGALPKLTAAHSVRQCPVVLVAAATADAAQPQVLRGLRCDWRQIEDLVANRLVLVHHHFTFAQRALRLGPAQDLLVDLFARQHGLETALVPQLCVDLASALGLGRLGEPRPGPSLDCGLEDERELSLTCSSSACSRCRISCIRSDDDSRMTVWHASTVAGRGGTDETVGVGLMLDSLLARAAASGG